VADPKVTETVELFAEVKATASGKHLFKVEGRQGRISVSVNDKPLLSLDDPNDLSGAKAIELSAGKTYGVKVTYQGTGGFTLGWDTPDQLFTPIDKVLAAAQSADAVIYFGGLSHSDDREGIDRVDMRLPNGQDFVIKQLLKANANTVVFLIAGSVVEMPWVDQAKTLVWSSYAGAEGGNAFADMLFGDVNPSGKLPVTMPYKLEHNSAIATGDHRSDINKYEEGVFIGYRWFDLKNIPPMFAFGHGLSYTDFELGNIKLSGKSLRDDQTLKVKVKVRNTGKRAGAEVVQLYLHDAQASVPRPFKELKQFAKVYLQPGEVKTVELEINRRDLSFWDENTNNWLAEPGEFEVLVGNALNNLTQKASFRLTR
jgi:beta-glucosidase